MNDLLVHALLFALLSAVIVLMSAFYSEPDDSKALRAFPRRLLFFFLGCAALTGLMLLAEHTVASVA